MKRWRVRVYAKQVELATAQGAYAPEYIVDTGSGFVVFARAVDELGAWIRAKELVRKEREG